MADRTGIEWCDATVGRAFGSIKTAARRVGLSVEDYQARVAVGEKYCTGCKAWHPRGDFTADRSRSDGLSATCRAIHNVRARQRYQPRPHRRGWLVKTRQGDKTQARRRVNYLVEQGLMPRPRDLACADCDQPAHEYDHARGYSADAQLYVEPVCRGCHHRREWSRRRG